MKVLKVVLIVLLILIGLVLAVPLFLPAEVTVSSETEVEFTPAQIFENAAVFKDRDKWDPWLELEPTADVTITPKKAYIGSTYEWAGEEIGSGKMRVDSVHFPNFIGSSIWFGDFPDPSTVEWHLESVDAGCKITWNFINKGNYPFGRLMNLFMVGALQESFDNGLANLKEYLAENPPVGYRLSEFTVIDSYDTWAIVLPAEGTMEEVAVAMQTGFPKLGMEIGKQGLTMNGPAFAHYLDFDHETGKTHMLMAFPVKEEAKASGDVSPKFYKAISAVSTVMNGDYAHLSDAYGELMAHVAAEGIEVTGEAFEIYQKMMDQSENPMEWETIVAFPIKK